MWENIVDDIKLFGKDVGFGCILTHAMGLGKTLQVIAFIEALLREFPTKTDKTGKQTVTTVLCVVPVNTISTWSNEFEKWRVALFCCWVNFR